MNALVGYGVSSESDSDGEASEEHNKLRSSQDACDHGQPAKKSRNLLLEADSGSSDSEEPEEEEKRPTTAPGSRDASRGGLPSPKMNKLPPPSLQTCSDTSVFTNPFKAQADQKLSALQKHVPLTEQARPSHIGGRRVCVSYRKDGRCRFGIKCKYAHDSDLQTSAFDGHINSGKAGVCGAQGTQGFQQDTEEKPEGQQVKKRKVGLSNTLIPPKRAMKQYAMQREKEGSNVL